MNDPSVSDLLWSDLTSSDPIAIAARCAVAYEEGSYQVPFLDRVIRINPDRRAIEDGHGRAVTYGEELALLSFLARGRAPAVEKVWITEKELPGGALFFRGPHALPAESITSRFGADSARFVERGQALGGVEAEFGDGSIELPVLPGIPICIALWEGDEEFPPACTFMFDRSFRALFPLDVVLALVAVVVARYLSE